MIKKIEDMNYYELLEVGPRATAQEIHRAYERIRRVYEPNSIALYSLFTPDETAAIHRRIEEAYRTLVYEDNRKRYDAMLTTRNRLQDPPPTPSAPKYQPRPVQPAFSLPSENRYMGDQEPAEQPRRQPLAEPPREDASAVSHLIAEFTGAAIKVLREQRGLTVRNVADITKISSRYLEFIEAENFKKLPARPYLRGFLVLYAKALGCDPERMAGEYLKRYDAALAPKPL
jgi:flagellar biosynthesis protein FlhG